LSLTPKLIGEVNKLCQWLQMNERKEGTLIKNDFTCDRFFTAVSYTRKMFIKMAAGHDVEKTDKI
jgi:hypothetical protein